MSRSVKTALGVLLIALACFSFKAAEKSIHSDFERYYTAGKAVVNGEDIYAAEGHFQFKYFPVFAQFMVPFSIIPQNIAVYFWYFFIAACFVGMLVISIKLSGCPPEKAVAVGLIILAICGRFFVNNARNGQINIPVAFFAYLGVFLVINSRERLGGFFTALAVCLKFMPVLLILFYLWKRKWRALLYSLLFTLVFLFIVPAFTWGFDGNLKLLDGYINRRSKMVESVAKKDSAGESIPAVLNRLFRDIPANTFKERKERQYSINIASLPVKTVNRIVLGVILSVVLVYIIATVKSFGIRDNKNLLALEAALVFIIMLLISPEARNAHYITLILPVGILASSLFIPQVREIMNPLYYLMPAFIFIMGTSSDIIGDAGSSYTSAYGCASIGAIILACGCYKIYRIYLNQN